VKEFNKREMYVFVKEIKDKIENPRILFENHLD
jgi:hypothetical protein